MTKLKIILVEDDPIWRDILERKIRLALEGITCSDSTIKVFKFFDEAYEALRDSFWHLLVTDIGLGDPSQSMLKQGMLLAELAYDRKIKVIAVSGTSGVTRKDVGNLFSRFRVSDFFDKLDFDSKQFIAKVQLILQQQEEMINMRLSSQQYEQLKSALIDAFPTSASLEQMLFYKLNKNLKEIASEGSLQDIVFQLIRTADAQGWVEELIRAACESNSGNTRLRVLAQKLTPNYLES